MNEETIRADFEQFMSDDGKWTKAIERDGAGNYILSQSASSWHVWRNAYHQCLQSTEIQAMRKDADRWRAWRKANVEGDNDFMDRYLSHGDVDEEFSEEFMDSCVDAAMEQQK